jgi:hypothetical protein
MATALTSSIDGSYTAPLTINVHFLDDGSGTGWENQGTITDAAGNTFGYDGWTAYEQQQARLAFAQFSAVANVAFNFVTDIAVADFVLATGNNAEVGSLGYWNVGGGTITVNGVDYDVDGVGVFNWEGQGWDFLGPGGGLEAGGFGFVTLLDNIAHGLGLAFPHDTDGGSTVMDGVTSPTGDFGDFDLNQGIYTTMSFNDGWPTAPHGSSPSDTYGWQGAPMALDIAVLQEAYGANMATNLGDTVYVLPDTNVTGTFYQAIWDAGGTDTIAYGGNGHATIDLRAATLEYELGGGGFVSYVSGIHGGFTIANGVVIENASGGAGNDTLIGNDADNVLTGGPGADSSTAAQGLTRRATAPRRPGWWPASPTRPTTPAMPSATATSASRTWKAAISTTRWSAMPATTSSRAVGAMTPLPAAMATTACSAEMAMTPCTAGPAMTACPGMAAPTCSTADPATTSSPAATATTACSAGPATTPCTAGPAMTACPGMAAPTCSTADPATTSSPAATAPTACSAGPATTPCTAGPAMTACPGPAPTCSTADPATTSSPAATVTTGCSAGRQRHPVRRVPAMIAFPGMPAPTCSTADPATTSSPAATATTAVRRARTIRCTAATAMTCSSAVRETICSSAGAAWTHSSSSPAAA